MTHMKSDSTKRNITSSFWKTAMIATIACVQSNVYAQRSGHPHTNIGLVYPLSSNGKNAPSDTNSFSLNLLAGVSAAERGVTIAGASNIIKQDAKGLQIAGLSNHVGKDANGTLIAGLLNSYAGGHGVAVAGLTNISSNGNGTQVSGVLNKGGNISALQVSGLVNIAGNVKGLQVAGFLNTAKKVRGLQLGFINVADSASTQIGIINISKNGEQALGLTIDENRTLMLTYRTGGKTIYGIIGTGYNFKNKRDKYAFEAGLGAHVWKIKTFALNAELVGGGIQSFKSGEYFKSSFRLMPAFKITPAIELFGGPSINYMNTNTDDGRKLTSNYISSWSRNNGRDLYGFYFGYTAGVKVSLF
jgi:hypothetical protein